ncbi:MAG: hypothetical protein FD124_2031 [Alphaproteobacteria bacterium]|nr:MAG: hypothetical protein FD160_526 [Caulobacteraceae bacterium]TPW05753.1 MAG: hypothetical protein FD124_2031 [Alphaproteobacteria bacterium]
MRWMRRLMPGKDTSGVLSPWGGEQVDVDLYWAQAWADLRIRQGEMARRLKLTDATWHVNQDAGLIEFQRADGALVRAPVQIIGSWNPKNEMFTWGWDHPSVHTRCRADAERTRWFGDAHDVRDLTARQVRVSEAEAWRLTAVAMKVNAAQGAYRGPTEGPVVFMTMGDLKILSEDPPGG